MATSVPMTPAGVQGAASNPYSKLLTPNEAVPEKAPKKDIIQSSKEDKKLIDLAKRLHHKAVQARKDRSSKWDTYWDFYNGKQWPVKRPSGKASPNVNVCRSTVQTILPILTDTSPSFGVVARDPTDFDFASLFTEAISQWWDLRSMNHVVVEWCMDALVIDCGILKVVWDTELHDGLGDVDVTVVDPRRIYVPENAVDFDRNCPWTIHEFFKSRGDLTMEFPDKKDEIKKAGAYAGQDGDSQAGKYPYDTRVRVVSPVNRNVPAPDNDDAGGDMSDNDDVRVWELWMESSEVIEVEEINKDTKESETITKKKYPHGRFITMLPDAKVVLQDAENPYRDGEKPFVKYVDTLIPRSFYGEGEVGPILETQRMVNRTFATIMDWSILMSNPSWIVDANSGVDPDMLTNQVGQVIVKNPNTTVQRQDAPGIPPQMFELYHTLTKVLETQSGAQEVSQGRKPTGVTAAQAIETLQEAAQTRIRLKERNLRVAMTRMGQLIVSRMLQYYTEPRVLKMTGQDAQGQWPSYVKFFVEHLDDNSFRPMTKTIDYDEMMEGYVEGEWQEGNQSIGDFELDVTTGTSLPFQKEQLGQQALQLFDRQAIDQEALLDVLDFPGKEEIMQRMSQAQQQAAEQAPPPGAPPGGAPIGPPPGVA